MQSQIDTNYIPPQVEITISCKELIDLDLLSKSDPFVVLYTQNVDDKTWKEFGRTETIDNCSEPKFVRTFTLDYYFEENQNLKFVVYDRDTAGNDLSKHDLIGETTCLLGEVLTAPGQRISRPLQYAQDRKRKNGFIIIQAEEIQGQADVCRIHLRGRKLKKMRWLWNKTDAFVVISKKREDGATVPVYKSEVEWCSTEPTWKPAEVPVQKLCNCDYNRPLTIEVFHHKASGNHQSIGSFETSLQGLTEAVTDSASRPLKHSHSGSIHGFVQVVSCEIYKEHSFLEYLAGGCEISLVVAVDFTSSNGHPTQTNSLHYYDPTGAVKNEYMKAITAVGEILMNYDTDKMVPAFGFGAQLPPNWQVSHCFALNGQEYQPQCHQVSGILEAYLQTLRNVRLHGPTVFSQVIRRAAQLASTGFSQQEQVYYILLIITDGVINDMDNTIEEIVKASRLPLSIVIVGVGNADFSNMDILDADDCPLQANGQTMESDIVQFVPFHKFSKMHYSRLAKETLAEIPTQFLSYMKRNKIRPNPPREYISLSRQGSMYPNVEVPSSQSFSRASAPTLPTTTMYGPPPVANGTAYYGPVVGIPASSQSYI